MMQPLKWTLVSLMVVMLLLVTAYASSVQNVTVRTTAEAEALLDTISVGTIRSTLNEKGEMKEEKAYVDTDELIANVTANVVQAQKTHPYDIQLDYVFLDKDGNVTKNENKVTSIQFRVQLVDNGEVKGTAERRLSLNQLKE